MSAPERLAVKFTEGYEHNHWGVVTDLYDDEGVEYVRADVAQAEAAASGWRPIETAPRDQTSILVYDPADTEDGINHDDLIEDDAPRATLGRVFESRWVRNSYEDAGGVWDGWNLATDTSPQPTHWMPLPAAPEVTE